LYSGLGALSLLSAPPAPKWQFVRRRFSYEAIAGQDWQKPFGAAIAGLV